MDTLAGGVEYRDGPDGSESIADTCFV
jgi:hypothetical protein